MNTKKDKKSENHEGWKALITGFVSNVLERVEDNVSKKIQQYFKMLKLKTLGFVLMAFGLLYLLIGFSVYLNSLLGIFMPGLGYIVVGTLALLFGYLVSNCKA